MVEVAKSLSRRTTLEEDYWTKCDVCDIETEITVFDDVEDRPIFCPMCGSEIEFEELED